MNENQNMVSVVVTGTPWMGSGIGSIETALHRLFTEAGDELLLTVYRITSGADLLPEWLESSLGRGIRTKVVVNRLAEQPSQVAVATLLRLARNYPHFELFDCIPVEDTDLHAKIVVADRRRAIVGSSNMSRRGLLTNLELAVAVEGPLATRVAEAVDRLIGSRYVTRVG
jgi:cardiolipin synthase